MNGSNGWSVRRRDTKHYLVSVGLDRALTTAKWSKQFKHAMPFMEYEEAREWVRYFGDRKPCYVEERRAA